MVGLASLAYGSLSLYPPYAAKSPEQPLKKQQV